MFSHFDNYNMPYTFTYNNTNNTNDNNDIDEMPQVSSPNISTPYLDSSIDTPYLDNNSSSPFLDTVPDFSPYLMYASLGPVPPYVMGGLNGKNLNDNKDDVCIARYLDGYENKNIAKLTHDPIAQFNGDPSALLIDKSKSPAINTHVNTKPSPTLKLENITEEKSDSLFPPLSSSQVSNNSYNDVSSYEDDAFERRSIDDILNFEANSPLSAEEDEFEMQDEEAQQTTKSTERKTESTESKKRKRALTSSVSDNTTSHENKKRKSVKAAKPKKPAKETKTFQCPLCDHVSKRRYNLSTHIKTHDKSRIKEFTCSQCTKRFDRRHDRDRHLATVHSKERSYTCDHCPTATTFTRRDALDRHLIQKHDYDESDLAE